jgi:hypothetical protein
MNDERGGLEMKTIRCILYVSVLLLVLLPACSSRTGGTIQDKGNQIELTTENHSVKASKMASINGTFVLFTANPVAADPALAYLDGRIIVMTKETADRLKSQYGNFVDANNKGHAEATKSIRHLSLLAADRQAQKQIKKLIELNTLRFFPLIKLSMTEIRVTDLLFKKSKVFLSGDLQKHYLVSKIDIIEDNYPL